MNHTPIRPPALLPALLLTLLLPITAIAAPSAPSGKAYLGAMAADASADAVTVHMRVRGAPVQSLSYRPGAVQLTLEGAFLDPAKQHIPVNHPVVREVFAYQFDPDTVRIRVLVEGVDARSLADGASLTAEPGSLHLALRGLPVRPASPEPEVRPAARDAAPIAEPAAAQAPQAEAAAPAEVAEVTEGAADRAAEARASALATFEEIVTPDLRAEPETAVAPEPETELAALDGTAVASGGGMPAVAASPEAAAPEAPAAAEPETQPETAAAPAPESAPDNPAPAVSERRPLLPLPISGGGAPSLWTSGFRMAGGLLVVLALLVAGLAALRRLKGTALGGRVPIRVLASASVGSRQNIVVVEVEGRRLVVGVGPGGTEMLADLDGAVPGGDGATALPPAHGAVRSDTPFGRALKRAGEKGTTEAISRARRDLERQIGRLKERSA